MRKYNVIPWSLVIALAAVLEQTISKQATLESLDATAVRVSYVPLTNEDEGKTIITKKKKTTTDDNDHPINGHRLEQINHVLAKYE